MPPQPSRKPDGIRDTAKLFNVPEDRVERLVESAPVSKLGAALKAIAENPKLRKLIADARKSNREK